MLCDTFAPRLERGAGLPPVDRIPYFAEQIVQFLEGIDLLVLVGSQAPVSFFAYPGKRSPAWGRFKAGQRLDPLPSGLKVTSTPKPLSSTWNPALGKKQPAGIETLKGWGSTPPNICQGDHDVYDEEIGEAVVL